MAFNYPAALTLSPEASGRNLIQALNDNSELVLQLSAGQTQDPFRVIDSNFGPLYRIGTGGLITAQSAVISGAATVGGGLQIWGAASCLNSLAVVGPTNTNALVAGGTTVSTLGVTGTTNLAALTAGPTSVGTLAASGLYVGPLSASGTITGTTALTRAASTGGLPAPILHVSNPADTSLPNVTYNGDVIFDFGANTRQLLGGAGAVGSLDLFQINAGTVTALSGQIISNAATVHIVGAPVSGTNIAFTNACALQVQGRICFGSNVAQSLNTAFSFQQSRNASQQTAILVAPTNSGNLNPSTEAPLIQFNPNGTITWATGDFAVQREVRLDAPTYAAAGTSTISGAATLGIAGAPAAGANMALINSYALWLQGGGLRCTGHLFFDGGTAPTAASGSAAGSAQVPAPVVVAGATDTRGTVTFGTGTAPTSGNMAVVTFGTAFTQAPYVMVSANNGLTALLHPYATAISTTGFTLGAGTAPLLNQGNPTYSFTWWVVQ